MSTYYSDHDVTAYGVAYDNYQAAHDAWSDTCDAAYQAYQSAHDFWEQNPTVPPSPEPMPPQLPVEPQPPPIPTTFSAEQVQTVTVISTPAGDIFVVPGRYVLTPDSGAAPFALSEAELTASYTDASTPLPQ